MVILVLAAEAPSHTNPQLQASCTCLYFVRTGLLDIAEVDSRLYRRTKHAGLEATRRYYWCFVLLRVFLLTAITNYQL